MAFLKSDSLQLLTILGTNGARIPPTLQDMEHTPSPAFLTHKHTYIRIHPAHAVRDFWVYIDYIIGYTRGHCLLT